MRHSSASIRWDPSLCKPAPNISSGQIWLCISWEGDMHRVKACLSAAAESKISALPDRMPALAWPALAFTFLRTLCLKHYLLIWPSCLLYSFSVSWRLCPGTIKLAAQCLFLLSFPGSNPHAIVAGPLPEGLYPTHQLPAPG